MFNGLISILILWSFAGWGFFCNYQVLLKEEPLCNV